MSEPSRFCFNILINFYMHGSFHRFDITYLELRNAFMVFPPNLEGENLIELFYVVYYVK